MSEKKTLERARRDERQGKPQAPRPENSCAKKCITSAPASMARARPSRPLRLGFQKPVARVSSCAACQGPGFGKSRRSAASAYRKGQRGDPVSSRRSQASVKALRREGRSAASQQALSRQLAAPRIGDISQPQCCRQKSGSHTLSGTLGLSVVGGRFSRVARRLATLGFGLKCR